MPCIFWAMHVHPQWPYLGPPLPPPCRRLLQTSKPMCCDAMELTKTESRSTADRTIVCFDQTEIHVASTVKNCLCLWAHATSRTLEPAILCHQWHQLCRLPWLWGDRVTVWSLRVHVFSLWSSKTVKPLEGTWNRFEQIRTDGNFTDPLIWTVPVAKKKTLNRSWSRLFDLARK